MEGNLAYCMALLQDNEQATRKDAEQVLLRLCSNIINNPQESRYRKIRLGNAVVATKLLAASGAIECLFEAGFIESDDGFWLPPSASLGGVERLHSLLAASPRPQAYRKQENTFLVQLMAHFRGVLRYEDASLQSKARAILPLDQLQISAMQRLRHAQRETKLGRLPDQLVFEDALLAELLSWFKFKFFTWVDTLACANCAGECYNAGARASSDARVSRIEIHKCKSCQHENQFARYTDPEALLQSRRGRCGEWANCFTLICRSAGFDARLVYDETDHVWTEVWSVAHGRWMHADACENALDRPLMYEKGWAKQLSYVVAFSRDEMQDVTWRYTRQRARVASRRRHCSEEALALFIRKLNQERQGAQGYSSARRKFVLRRSACELAGMLDGPPGQQQQQRDGDSEDAYAGRSSGSIAWRLSRGEVSPAAHQASRWLVPAGLRTFQLSYDVASDSYATMNLAEKRRLETRQGWQSGVERLEGAIFRKEEPDWRMVYLARCPGVQSASISWSLAMEHGAAVDSIKLRAQATTFGGATLRWQVEALLPCEDGAKQVTKVLLVEDCRHFESADVRGASKISVSATLSGGQGDVAWQHAQLFRRSLDGSASEQQPSLLIQIDLASKIL